MMNILSGLFGTKPNFKQLLNDGAIIVDVRTPQEYDAGHIKGSMNIPLDIIPNKAHDLKNRNKAVITVCRSGARSAMAADTLKKVGVEAYNGGGWSSFMQQM